MGGIDPSATGDSPGPEPFNQETGKHVRTGNKGLLGPTSPAAQANRSWTVPVESIFRRVLVVVGVAPVVLVVALYAAPPIIRQSTNVYSLDFVARGNFQFGNPATFVVNYSLDPTPGVSTSMFALKIGTQFGANISLGVVPDGCTAGVRFVDNDVSPCVAPRFGWYAVIVGAGSNNGAGAVTATLGNQTFQWSPLGIELTHAVSFYIVSRPDLSGSGDVVSIYGINGANVIGQARL